MKTVLKDVKTGLLFRNMDEWTSDLDQAAGFRDTLTALKFCQRNNLDGAAIIHVFGAGKVERVVGFYRRNPKATQSIPSASSVLNPQAKPEEPLNREQSLS
jgi:hypothetical protein